MTLPRRFRLPLLVLAGVAAAFALAVVVTLYLLLQPARFTAMLQSKANAAGLELSLASPPSPSLFPHPSLDLEGLTLTAQGANVPILLAAQGRLALPWRTIFGGPTAISQLEIDAPRVDLGALQHWLSTLPPRPASAPLDIPRIDTGVRITQGSVVDGNDLLLNQVTLDAGRLLPGQLFLLDLSARTASGTPVRWRLSAIPRMQDKTLQLDAIALHVSEGNALELQLAGQARWQGAANASLQLQGTLASGQNQRYAASLALTPANQASPLLLTLKLDGAGNHVNLRLPPLALASWWSQLRGSGQAPQLAVPPGDGSIAVDRLDTGGVQIEGLRVQVGDAAPPTPATAPSPPRPAAVAKPRKKAAQ